MNVAPAGAEADLLREGAAALGVVLDPEQQSRLLRFLELLYLWNRTAGLTTIARADAVRLHLLDSLAAVPAVEHGPCVDLGSGGGLPGVVLAVCRPEMRVVLVESNRRKSSFLREVVREAGLANVEVLQCDYAVLAPRSYATVVSRAFRPPLEFLEIAAPLVAPGGSVILMLAGTPEDELRDLGSAAGLELACFRTFGLTSGPEQRTVGVYRRAASADVSRET